MCLMKKVFVPVVFVFAFFAIASTALAAGPELTLSADSIDLYNIAPGNEASLDVTIKNTANRYYTFTVDIFPDFWNYVTNFPLPSVVTLNPGETTVAKLNFQAFPGSDFGARTFSVTVAAAEDSNVTSNVSLLVRIVRKSPVFIVDSKADKAVYDAGEKIKINSTVTNENNENSGEFLLQVFIKKDEQTIKSFDNFIENIPPKQKKVFTNEYQFGEFADPGSYSVTADLRNNLGFLVSRKSFGLTVSETVKAPEQKTSSEFFFLSMKTSVTSRNVGNAPAPMTITATVPVFAKDLFTAETKPTSVASSGGNVVYTWTFDKVAPGKEVSITYSYSLWQVWVILLALAGVVYFAYRYVFTPAIVKHTTHRGRISKENEIVVLLEIKNRSMSDLKDLVVNDFIPPFAKIVHKFDTIRPQIKESSQGTEVMWKFDNLRAGEERVMMYRVKPTIDVVGSLSLPQASLRYSDRKKQRLTKRSREVALRGA